MTDIESNRKILGTAPVRFQGTPEQARANYETHAWTTYWYGEEDAETVCAACDAKPWHAAAEYPCGADVPRQTIVMRVQD